jgi:hypothetical protein
VRVRHAFALAVGVGLLVVTASCNWTEPAVLIHVHADPDSLSRCFLVLAIGEDGGIGKNAPHALSAGETLSVGVFQGALSSRVTLEAEGFTAADCADPVDERSGAFATNFATGPFPEGTLTLHGEGSCSDGMDGDGDGKIDCADSACAASPSCADSGTATTGPFPYPPSNFSPDALPVPDAGLVINCDAGYDTGTRTGFLCGAPPPPSYLLDAGTAGPVVLLAVNGLTITPAGQWHITGPNPLIVAVFGDAGLSGPMFGGAIGAEDGPGVRRAGCLGSGAGGRDGGNGGGGGGGGGYGRLGGPGAPGAGAAPAAGGDGGATFGTKELVPLLAGCPGGSGGVQSTAAPLVGGGAGGALQVSVAGTLQVSSAIGVPGGGGRGATVSSNNGGGGGGSGGAVLLEGNQLVFTSSARVTANGGGGGEGADSSAASTSRNGADGRLDGPFPAAGGAGTSIIPGGDGGAGTIDATSGSIQTGSNFGGGGGGGAVGRIRLNAALGCSFQSPAAQVLSPPATSNQRGDAGCP